MLEVFFSYKLSDIEKRELIIRYSRVSQHHIIREDESSRGAAVRRQSVREKEWAARDDHVAGEEERWRQREKRWESKGVGGG